jgi:hypothetical protein
VLDGTAFFAVEIDMPLRIRDDRILGDRVPKAGDNLHELFGPFVTLGLFEILLVTEGVQTIWILTCDDVPGRTPLADVIKRGDLAGNQIGVAEDRRGCCDKAYVLGGDAKRRQQGDRVERAPRTLIGLVRKSARGIGQENRVELAGFGDARNLRELVNVGRQSSRIRQCLPGGVMASGCMKVDCEPNGLVCRHGTSLSFQ